MWKIINKVTGETVGEMLIGGCSSCSLDDALRILGEIFPENEDENVLIDGKWYYYEDLDLVLA